MNIFLSFDRVIPTPLMAKYPENTANVRAKGNHESSQLFIWHQNLYCCSLPIYPITFSSLKEIIYKLFGRLRRIGLVHSEPDAQAQSLHEGQVLWPEDMDQFLFRALVSVV